MQDNIEREPYRSAKATAASADPARLPQRVYATVTSNGEAREFPTRKEAIEWGESRGGGFTVLSPRGYISYVQE